MRSQSHPAPMVPTKFRPAMMPTVMLATWWLMPMSSACGIMLAPMRPLEVPPQMA